MMSYAERQSEIFPSRGGGANTTSFYRQKGEEIRFTIQDNGSVIIRRAVTFCLLKSVQISVKFTDKIEICTFKFGGEVVDNKAIIRYKFYLCRNFLDKLLRENIPNEVQRKRIENSVIKRLAEV